MKKISFIFLLFLFVSCEAVFVEDISTDRVVTLAPTENSTVASGNITFSWQLLDEADMYQIQIATPTFESASQIVLDSVVDSNSAQKMLDVGEYQWRIKGMNSEYETNYTTVSFTVN
jgi:hypothetical protein